jgi:hypothetical protein
MRSFPIGKDGGLMLNRQSLRGEYPGSKTEEADGRSRSERRAHLHVKYAKSVERALAKAELGVLPGWAFGAMKDGVKAAGSLSGVDPKAKRELLSAAAVRQVKAVKAEREEHNAQCAEGLEVKAALPMVPSREAAKVFLRPTDATAPLSGRVTKLAGRAKPSKGATNLRSASMCAKTGTFAGEQVPARWEVRD